MTYAGRACESGANRDPGTQGSTRHSVLVSKQPTRSARFYVGLLTRAQIPCHFLVTNVVNLSRESGYCSRAADDKARKAGLDKIDAFPEDVSTILVHHSSILRNKRLLLAYR